MPFDARLASTAYAVLFLVEGARPPAAAFVSATNGATPALLTATLKALREREGYRLACVPIPADDLSGALGCPFLFLDSGMRLEAAARAPLQAYLDRGGTVIVTDGAAPTNGTGRFLPLVRGGRAGSLSKEADFLRDYKGAMPAFPTVARKDGTLAVLWLPYADSPGATAPPAAPYSLWVAFLLLRERLKPIYGDAAWPSRVEQARGDYRRLFDLRSDILRRLDEGAEMPDAGPKPATDDEKKEDAAEHGSGTERRPPSEDETF